MSGTFPAIVGFSRFTFGISNESRPVQRGSGRDLLFRYSPSRLTIEAVLSPMDYSEFSEYIGFLSQQGIRTESFQIALPFIPVGTWDGAPYVSGAVSAVVNVSGLNNQTPGEYRFVFCRGDFFQFEGHNKIYCKTGSDAYEISNTDVNLSYFEPNLVALPEPGELIYSSNLVATVTLTSAPRYTRDGPIYYLDPLKMVEVL